MKFSLTERCSHPGEDHTNEIKHDIHPEWVDRDRFNIKTKMAAVYMTTGQLQYFDVQSHIVLLHG